MPVGPDFISLQVRDLDIAASFYEERLGLRRAPGSPPGAVLFASQPIPLAVRELLPATDLDAGQPGLGSRSGSRSMSRRWCTTSSPHKGSQS